MKIASTEDSYSYLLKLQQTTERVSNSVAKKDSSAIGSTAQSDSVEISSEAYDALASDSDTRLKQPPPPPPPPPSASSEQSGNSNSLVDVLGSLVENGTITSELSSAISDALSSSSSASSSSASSTDTSNQTNPLKTMLDNLKSDGTLTQEQLSVIVSTLTPPDYSESDVSNTSTRGAVKQ